MAATSTPVRPSPAPELDERAHKGDAGRVLCVAGSREMPGAAVLCVRAAARAGAGLVSLACLDPSLLTIVPASAPETVLLDWSEGRVDDRFWREHTQGRGDDARVMGPGLGQSPRTRALIEAVRDDGFGGPTVLDADALNVIGASLDGLDLPHLVLTPHPGEATRLLARPIPTDSQGRIDAALEISRRAQAICVLKGHQTVVAQEDARDGPRVYVNASGNPGMATGGSGDVLSGITVSYLAARGADFTPFQAVVAAVYVHGLAGDLAAAERGRRGLIASDLIDFLPRAQQRFAAEFEPPG